MYFTNGAGSKRITAFGINRPLRTKTGRFKNAHKIYQLMKGNIVCFFF